MGLFLIGGHLLKILRKAPKEPANCLYSVPAISVSTSQQFRVGQIIWFGWLCAISQLASRVGEGGGVWQVCMHSVTQPHTTWPRWREQGEGLRSLPLVQSGSFCSIFKCQCSWSNALAYVTVDAAVS
jgi:hypothetical protein